MDSADTIHAEVGLPGTFPIDQPPDHGSLPLSLRNSTASITSVNVNDAFKNKQNAEVTLSTDHLPKSSTAPIVAATDPTTTISDLPSELRIRIFNMLTFADEGISLHAIDAMDKHGIIHYVILYRPFGAKEAYASTDGSKEDKEMLDSQSVAINNWKALCNTSRTFRHEAQPTLFTINTFEVYVMDYSGRRLNYEAVKDFPAAKVPLLRDIFINAETEAPVWNDDSHEQRPTCYSIKIKTAGSKDAIQRPKSVHSATRDHGTTGLAATLSKTQNIDVFNHHYMITLVLAMRVLGVQRDEKTDWPDE